MTLDKPTNVCVLVGSLRKASLTGMLANALISLAPSSMKPEVVEIGQLPFYNEDLERYIDPPPAPWTAFRQHVKAADAVLFVTPEYNRSVPAVLKNALDVGSRPYGSSVWNRKPVRSSAARRARSEPSAPIIISGSRSCSLTCRPCSSPKPMSVMSTSCSMSTASSPTTAPANSCRTSCRRLRIGSIRFDLRAIADSFEHDSR
jgi:NAD(P)H-dependent FMN reductase